MKILNIIASTNPKGGGPIAGIIAFAEVLVPLGHTFDVLCLDSNDAPWVIEQNRNPNLNIIAIGPALANYSYTSKLKPWLFENSKNYDCVIVRGLWQYCGLATWLVLKEINIPYFVFSHGMLDPWFNKNYPIKKIKKIIYWIFAEHHVLSHAKAVLFNSKQEMNRSRNVFWPYLIKECLVPYGTSSVSIGENSKDKFFKKFPELKDKKFLLFLGRIHEKKGIDLLLSAFKEEADKETMLLVAGPGDLAPYKKMIEDFNPEIASRVIFSDMLLGEEKAGAFSLADAFCLFSHQENFGISVVEALSAGLPVLISDKVNIWTELLEAGVALVDKDNQQGANSLLKSWFTLDPQAKLEMREKAKECFNNNYNITKVAPRFVEVIEAAFE